MRPLRSGLVALLFLAACGEEPTEGDAPMPRLIRTQTIATPGAAATTLRYDFPSDVEFVDVQVAAPAAGGFGISTKDFVLPNAINQLVDFAFVGGGGLSQPMRFHRSLKTIFVFGNAVGYFLINEYALE